MRKKSDRPACDSLTVCKLLAPIPDPDAGPMPIEFAYVLIKDFREIMIEFCVDRAARYMSKTASSNMN